MIDRSDPLWYKDAIIYQLHVKAFFDANNDGIGDFAGLMQKLDYIQDLGVTAIWLMPFYPSPLRDDGYDIADYRTINPSYGALRDFRRFLAEAHKRGIRVITELVINHTSDAHPWFQRARNAKPGSWQRDFYVWSDTDEKYDGTRIIFLDTEPSNWSWDPVAQAYYWHRFYAHQPDLNFASPRVLRAVLNTLHFWLRMGVDGLRLDAIPYLCERDGTNNENLPETHEVLKRIRAEVDDHYPDRMLLAEANQWPEDTAEYFGAGDECHLSFHFPLMPRIYMALAQEDRHPITDILRQTPDIPQTCQWAIFLRNHDELTLEMVTDDERDYLWRFYATDQRMRINLGIRRRLAPLMERDRRKIELMNALLMSMPGTPILYYGDEIGMGDNIFLGDRDGVRTPMQWSPDRNGGFSRADPARLYLPAIMDPVYGYEAINVEAQQRDPSSMLNWMRRLIATRRGWPLMGRGSLRFLYPGNRKVLAYLREDTENAVLCVANLSRNAQAVELDLSEFNGRTPVELLGHTPFPPIGTLPYLLTLPSYGFYWFVLAEQAELPRWHEPLPEPLPELITLVMRRGWVNLVAAREAERLAKEVLPAYLPKRRWFATKDLAIKQCRFTGLAEIPGDADGYLLATVEVAFGGSQAPQLYFLPLATSWDKDAVSIASPLMPFMLAKVRRVNRVGGLYDAVMADGFCRSVCAAIAEGRTIAGSDGEIAFSASERLADVGPAGDEEIKRMAVEQSNSSVMIADKAVLKVYRRLAPGPHPELELGRFLTDTAGYQNIPPLLGAVEHVAPDGTRTALAVLQGFVRNQGDGWQYTQAYLGRALDALGGRQEPDNDTEAETHDVYLSLAATLGRRTGELHRALAIETDDRAIAAEPIRAKDLTAWRRAALRQADAAFRALRGLPKDLPERVRSAVRECRALEKVCRQRIEAATAEVVDAAKIRIHGDYHLGQVVLTQDDFHILDLEGEPGRPLAERRAKYPVFKDVAGMLRSFDYAAWAAAFERDEHGPESFETVIPALLEWRDLAIAAFMRGYRESIAGASVWPDSNAAAQRLCDLFTLQKALYEICYEAGNRPTWTEIPVRGVLEILGSDRK